MQTVVLASSLIRSREGLPQLDPRELELSYAGPRHGLKEVTRVAAALGSVVAYAGLLAYAWQ